MGPFQDHERSLECHIFHISCHLYKKLNTVKPAHAVTSIKQSPASKSHIFLILS